MAILRQVQPQTTTALTLWESSKGARGHCTLRITNTTTALTYRVMEGDKAGLDDDNATGGYDVPIKANGVHQMTVDTGNYILIRASAAGLTFTLYDRVLP